MKKIVIHKDNCVNCGRCEVFCIANHSESRDIIKAFKREGLRGTNRVVLLDGFFAVNCRHCDGKPCVDACISGSMHTDEDGAVRNDEEKCVGCWSCIVACPYGAVRQSGGTKRFALKCDLCVKAGEPACVKACPNLGLELAEAGEA